MRTITSAEAERTFGKILEDAKSGPVAVAQNGKPSAVILSFDEYQRITGKARQDLLDVMRDTQAYAVSQGLTEEKLEQLLADDS